MLNVKPFLTVTLETVLALPYLRSPAAGTRALRPFAPLGVDGAPLRVARLALRQRGLARVRRRVRSAGKKRSFLQSYNIRGLCIDAVCFFMNRQGLFVLTLEPQGLFPEDRTSRRTRARLR